MAARRLHRSGAGTVLDLLLRQVPRDDRGVLVQWLEQEAGIVAVLDDHEAAQRVDGALPAAVQSLGAVALSLGRAEEFVIGLADPWDDAVAQQIARVLGRPPRLAAVSGSWLSSAHGMSLAVEPVTGRPGYTHDASVTGVVVDFVDAAIRGACAAGASDVHFECDRAGIGVKLRLDGVLQRFARLEEPRRAEEVISRIKVLAQLDITEKRVPQDGRFRYHGMSEAVDLRVSIMPSVHGEDAVLRILDKAQLRTHERGITLDRLGFSASAAEALRDLGSLPHGMLLVTGPTGSGKTTTVYAVLSEFNDGMEKIVTIEDPVEYELPGVLQIPVNDRKGLTFARGLRSILRHDPDRILVGEIRDAETAEIAVQSALTGHQVFTTVHANSVFDVIGRFRHFGLDMHGFTSALNGVVVQRLLRSCCPHCTGLRAGASHEREWMLQWGQVGDEVPLPRGCEQCRDTGYKGRRVLAEVHSVDDHFRDLVTARAPLSALREKVDADGPPTLHRQAAELVARGLTTLEEVRRVVGWR